MTRFFAPGLAALYAFLGFAIGFGVPLLLSTLVWTIQYGMAGQWMLPWSIAGQSWLLSHGVPLEIQLDAALTEQLQLPESAAHFHLSLPLLGLALFTVWMGHRVGHALAQYEHPRISFATAVLVFALLSTLLALSSSTEVVAPVLWRAVLLPAVIFAIGLALGLWRAAARPLEQRLEQRLGLSAPWPALVGVGLRIAGAVVLVLIAAGALLALLALITGYTTVITLYESLHAGVLGGLTITLVQAALLPNVVIWGAAWLLGPGFSIGIGSAVSPFGSHLGPLPAVPIFGALPDDQVSLAFLGVLVPVVTAFVACWFLKTTIADAARGSFATALVPPAIAAITAAALMGVLCWSSRGSLGPGRLEMVGADPWPVMLAALLLTAVGAVPAAVLGVYQRSR